MLGAKYYYNNPLRGQRFRSICASCIKSTERGAGRVLPFFFANRSFNLRIEATTPYEPKPKKSYGQRGNLFTAGEADQRELPPYEALQSKACHLYAPPPPYPIDLKGRLGIC